MTWWEYAFEGMFRSVIARHGQRGGWVLRARLLAAFDRAAAVFPPEPVPTPAAPPCDCPECARLRAAAN